MEKESLQSPERKESIFSLRKVTESDIEDFLVLERSVSTGGTYSGIETREEALKELEENEVYFLCREGRVVGSAAFQLKSPDHAYISGVVIPPNFQGQGIGREAVQLLLEKLKDIKKIDLVTHPGNERARRLYSSFGFKQVGEQIEDYFGDGEPRIVMVLDR